MWASRAGHLMCVTDLLDKDAEVNTQNKVSAIIVGPFCVIDVRPPCVKNVLL